MLKSPLFWKMSTLLGCILLLSIPLMIVRQLIVETGRAADRHSRDRGIDPH